MSRSERLLELLQCLRRHRRPVSGETLAGELGISLRTLYRDIASLRAQGAPIEGEAGVGFLLKPGFVLPPMMFTDDEIEALVLGSRWVATRADSRLALAADHALAKIAAVLPADLREALEDSSLLVAPPLQAPPEPVHLAALRKAIRDEHRLDIRYADAEGAVSARIVWPFALGFFDRTRVLVAWCELRRDFRHFRTDRIEAAETTGERYPRRRRALLSDWRKREGMAQHS